MAGFKVIAAHRVAGGSHITVNSAALRFCQPLPRNMWETHDPAGDIHDKYNLTGNGHSP
jgi:hypothetical protein